MTNTESSKYRKILVVDDEELMRKITTRIVERLGYEVSDCESGVAAIEQFTENPNYADIVLLDLVMPYLSGEETFRKLRVIRPDLDVIIMSGYCEEDDIQHLIAEGARGFMQKPLTIPLVEEKLNALSQ